MASSEGPEEVVGLVVSASASATEAEREKLNPGYPQRDWPITPDNSETFELTDPLDPAGGVLTLDELLTVVRWVMVNAHRFAARRIKRNDVPPMAWGLAVWLLDKPEQFMNFASGKLKEAERPRAEALKEVELAKIEASRREAELREVSMQKRRASNGPLRDVLERVEARFA